MNNRVTSNSISIKKEHRIYFLCKACRNKTFSLFSCTMVSALEFFGHAEGLFDTMPTKCLKFWSSGRAHKLCSSNTYFITLLALLMILIHFYSGYFSFFISSLQRWEFDFLCWFLCDISLWSSWFSEQFITHTNKIDAWFRNSKQTYSLYRMDFEFYTTYDSMWLTYLFVSVVVILKNRRCFACVQFLHPFMLKLEGWTHIKATVMNVCLLSSW